MDKLRQITNWGDLAEHRYSFFEPRRVDYIHEPFMTVYVDSQQSFRDAIGAMEEEALMYVVNESHRGRPVEIKDLIPDKDLIIGSKGTLDSDVFNDVSVKCVLRVFEHKGDMYQDSDIVLRNGLNLRQVPIAVKIDTTGQKLESGNYPVNISAAVICTEAEQFELGEYSVHFLKPQDKKSSTLDILLGMQ